MNHPLLRLLAEVGQTAIIPGIAVAVMVASKRRRGGSWQAPAWWKWVESRWSALARHPVLVAALLCSIQIVGVAIRYMAAGPPIPHVHDEFSYLMAGETFAMGRMAFPTHPMWVHFESPHIIQVPTRASFYPPGQAIMLAAGILIGHPWFGVVLSSLLMIVAVYWAARQWLSPFWSLPVGVLGLLVVLGTYWTNSYWGGALNTIAGALVIGAAGALRRRASRLQLSLLAAGIVLCGITRPFGGSVLAVLTCAWLLFRIAGKGREALSAYLRASGPAVLVLAASTGLFLYDNYEVTGNPWRLPYTEGAEQYIARRKFLWEDDPPTPVYRHKELRDVYVGLMRKGFSPYWRLLDNISGTTSVILGMGLLPLFLVSVLLPLRGWRGNLLPPVLLSAVGILTMLNIPWVHPHYYGPFVAATLIATMTALRAARCFHRISGRCGWIIVATAIVLLAARGGIHFMWQISVKPSYPKPWARQRSSIEKRLTETGLRHIIIVRYSPDHNWNEEWVYNHADIDRSRVVWAREMGRDQNALLLAYFKDRKAWLLEADASEPGLTPYPRPGP